MGICVGIQFAMDAWNFGKCGGCAGSFKSLLCLVSGILLGSLSVRLSGTRRSELVLFFEVTSSLLQVPLD